MDIISQHSPPVTTLSNTSASILPPSGPKERLQHQASLPVSAFRSSSFPALTPRLSGSNPSLLLGIHSHSSRINNNSGPIRSPSGSSSYTSSTPQSPKASALADTRGRVRSNSSISTATKSKSSDSPIMGSTAVPINGAPDVAAEQELRQRKTSWAEVAKSGAANELKEVNGARNGTLTNGISKTAPSKTISAHSPSRRVAQPSKVPVSTPSTVIASAPRKQLKMDPLVQVLILRRMLLLTDGRDKVMKVIQYGLKAAMWAELLTAKKQPAMHARASKIVSNFSTARKIIRLLYWLNSLDELIDLNKTSAADLVKMTPNERLRHNLSMFNAIVGIVNGWADDVVVAGKLGLIEKPLYNRATILSDRLWYVTIFFDLYENIQAGRVLSKKVLDAQRQYVKADGDVDDIGVLDKKRTELLNKQYMHRISLVKLVADFTFCTVDVFQLGERGLSDGWQALSGLTSALLGTYKVWVKHR
ncbi:peroxisomal biogenesis factor 11-domain-containing protein [Fimicolochytrium jonesii]|uniref:peroxisomal biogenesis factor 11-domain-containing protein n=1 Tax=Fimicolochytrium jonesii TaxID=1396493 RepID=UPI0022FED2FF|nr:peroxisomal biogenesis factor 11-domain-containing protein [Fimicolochytrium jonesii]KAI8818603.1 peroxisomal biogenesis factor 11-domain-containing protein [Fimicolochytrium jonesii]